jgi:hypothetical protein
MSSRASSNADARGDDLLAVRGDLALSARAAILHQAWIVIVVVVVVV